MDSYAAVSYIAELQSKVKIIRAQRDYLRDILQQIRTEDNSEIIDNALKKVYNY